MSGSMSDFYEMARIEDMAIYDSDDLLSMISSEFLQILDDDDNFKLSESWYLPDASETDINPISSSILRHDCMWNGQCVDKDHDYNLCNKWKHLINNPSTMHNNNNRSILISNTKIEKKKNTTKACNKKNIKKFLDANKQNINTNNYYDSSSNGNSLGTSPVSDFDNDIPTFKHEISINDKLSEYMNEFKGFIPVSEATGQTIIYNDNNKGYFGSRTMVNISQKQMMNNNNYQNQTNDKNNNNDDDDEEEDDDQTSSSSSSDYDDEEEEDEEEIKNMQALNNAKMSQYAKEKEMQQNTLNDHCYYINNKQNPNAMKFDHLGVCTPSDSEEEIDVVTFEKPMKPAVLPTYPSPAERKSFQVTVNNALKDKPAPRPRGRPPLNSNNNNNNNNNNIVNNINNNYNNNINININNNNNNNIIINNNANNNCRKRVVQEQKQTKRAKQTHPYQRKTKAAKNNQIKLPVVEPIVHKQEPMIIHNNNYDRTVHQCEEEPELDKRNLHNNMERQRRVELKESFDNLRRLVPDLVEIDKAPKVKILNTAADYCDILTTRYHELNYQKHDLEQTQMRLREKLSKLRQIFSERFLNRAH